MCRMPVCCFLPSFLSQWHKTALLSGDNEFVGGREGRGREDGGERVGRGRREGGEGAWGEREGGEREGGWGEREGGEGGWGLR